MIRIGGSTARAIRVEAETDETDRETDQLASGQMSEALPERVEAMKKKLEAWQQSVIRSLNGEDYVAK